MTKQLIIYHDGNGQIRDIDFEVREFKDIQQFADYMEPAESLVASIDFDIFKKGLERAGYVVMKR